MELPAPAVVPVPLLAPPALPLMRSPSAAFSPLAASTGGDCGLAVKPLEKLQVSCEASAEEPVLLYWKKAVEPLVRVTPIKRSVVALVWVSPI